MIKQSPHTAVAGVPTLEKHAFLRKIEAFIKKNTVLVIAVIAALVTTLFVPPDIKYLGYFDFRTLSCLYCVLAVVCALRNIRFFRILARKVVERFGTARRCVIALVYITFIGSMLIANDMALLTFLPLGYFVLESAGKQKYMAVTFILQNIAANLGGMLTPFGNPQNLYIFSRFSIPVGEFMTIMLPPFLLSVLLITGCCFFIKPEPLTLPTENVRLDAKKSVLYAVLFVLSIAIVFRVIPYYIGPVVITAVLLFADRRALRDVDYPLLLTFASFFVFAGNMARIDAVREFFATLLEKSTLIFSVLSCQIISNVPSAVLLSQFTDNYADLLVGVNIGGVGTLIASLASLITYREYTKHNPRGTAKYIGLFSAFNFGFLIVLTAFQLVLKSL